jgi:dipeptidyl aminopeptidase/acylaminoacyl peptidase
MTKKFYKILCGVGMLAISILPGIGAEPPAKKKMTFDDAMKFKTMRGQVISDNGVYVAYFAYPDRGDYEGYLKPLDKDTTYKIPNGISPVFDKTSSWTFFTIRPKSIELENAEKEKPKNGLAIVKNSDGKITSLKNVGSFIVSNDGNWLVYESLDKTPAKADDKKKNRPTGKNIVIRNLNESSELELSDVSTFKFDSLSTYFTYVKSDKDAKSNGLYYIDLNAKFALPRKADGSENFHVANLSWNEKKSLLAYTIGKERFDGKPDSIQLKMWDPSKKSSEYLVKKDMLKSGIVIPQINKLEWSEDGERLFFGVKEYSDTSEYFDKIVYNDSNYFNIDTIRKQTTLDMWSTKDARIKTHQKNWWDAHKDDTYAAVFDLINMKYTQLGDENLADVSYADNRDYTIGFDEKPYLYMSTWDIGASDLYKVNLHTGERKLIQKEVRENAYLSPEGNYVVYYKDKQWYSHNTKTDTTACLTSKLKVAFYEEEHDTPNDPSAYGFAGWLKNDEAVLLYDKYDVWQFGLSGANAPLNLTDASGRRTGVSFRNAINDPKKKFYSKDETVYLTGFDTKLKNRGVFSYEFSSIGSDILLMDKSFCKVIAKAKNANKYLMSKEAYDMFPDLWVSDSSFSNPQKITDVNPQMSEYAWGKMDLISWVGDAGDSLQGYYIKPDNFDPKKRYPVVIFFYEIMSDDAYHYSNPWNNHLPSAPMYAGDDYVMFYPDVKFKIGSPGKSSIDCIIPGVRKLSEVGVADTNAIGLWGHSWSGYQTAYMITQTDFFACGVAGAPVGNMTSAYSGIRLESGLTRQFQYEHQQSRIGGSLWDSLSAYIRNSPVFFANKVHTPLLIEFGNLDDAVPWTQGMELFLALRRAGKDATMLEYRNEPHHPRKYFNRLDYAIRMKEFYDYYLKKKTAPDWILKGIEYKGK